MLHLILCHSSRLPAEKRGSLRSTIGRTTIIETEVTDSRPARDYTFQEMGTLFSRTRLWGKTSGQLTRLAGSHRRQRKQVRRWSSRAADCVVRPFRYSYMCLWSCTAESGRLNAMATCRAESCADVTSHYRHDGGTFLFNLNGMDCMLPTCVGMAFRDR
jgi:hypothetical protein